MFNEYWAKCNKCKQNILVTQSREYKTTNLVFNCKCLKCGETNFKWTLEEFEKLINEHKTYNILTKENVVHIQKALIKLEN